MNNENPNDRLRNRRAGNSAKKSDKLNFIDRFTDTVNRFFKSAGVFFVNGYRKYDAFIRRIFKLDVPEQNNVSAPLEKNKENDLEELRTYTRSRRAQSPDDYGYDEQISDMEKTQSYNHMPDYLQQKTYDEPAPIDRHGASSSR